MKKVLFLFFLMLGVVSSGCAIGTTRVVIDHDPLVPIVQKKKGNIAVEPFKDVREQKEYIGNKRNGFGMVLGHIGTMENETLEGLLTKYFAEALTEAGYNVYITGGSPIDAGAKIDLTVSGEIKEFFLDLYMMTWHYMTVDLKAFDPETRQVAWEKEVKSEEKVILWIGATAEFERVIRLSLTKALDQAAKEFASDDFSKYIKQDKETSQ